MFPQTGQEKKIKETGEQPPYTSAFGCSCAYAINCRAPNYSTAHSLLSCKVPSSQVEDKTNRDLPRGIPIKNCGLIQGTDKHGERGRYTIPACAYAFTGALEVLIPWMAAGTQHAVKQHQQRACTRPQHRVSGDSCVHRHRARGNVVAGLPSTKHTHTHTSGKGHPRTVR